MADHVQNAIYSYRHLRITGEYSILTGISTATSNPQHQPNFRPQHSRRHRRHTSSSTSSSSSPANPRRSLPHKQKKGGGRERRRPHMLTVPKRLTSHGYFAPNPDSKSRSRETNYFDYYFLAKQGNISFDFGRILIQQ